MNNNLESLVEKLNSEGYKSYKTIMDKVEFVKGTIISSDIKKSLNTYILVKMIDNNYVLINFTKQTANETVFNNLNALVDFIKKKYPI